MKRATNAALWLAPLLACYLLYQHGLRAWFQADDFAWLSQGLDVHGFHDLLWRLFAPKAQGTIRPWSERAFFMGFYALFGLDALPYRIFVFLTQAANLLLVAAIGRRLTGSPAAGCLAALLWCANTALGQVMSWTSTYNETLCGFFLLLAFYFLLLSIDSGRRAHNCGQWAAFLLGFGALEIIMVYPALAALYTFLCARKYFRRTLPLFIPSLLFGILHAAVAPLPKEGVYVMHFDGALPRTLATYWGWSVACVFLYAPTLAAWVIPACIALVSVALLGFAVRQAMRGQWLGVFFLGWFLLTLAPVLPLRDHLTDYYIFLPTIGLALLGGWGLVYAWRAAIPWKAAAVAAAAVYLVVAVPQTRRVCDWNTARSRRVENVVLGVARAHELHPGKTILLDGVDDALFWTGVLDRPYLLVGIRDVFLTPGSDAQIAPHPEWGNPSEYVVPPDAALRALDRDEAVVYSVRGERLKNITSMYAAGLAAQAHLPLRVDIANPLLSYVLGPEWYPVDQDHRWMPRRATLRLSGPAAPGQKLYLSGISPEAARIAVTAEGQLLGSAQVPNGSFDLVFPLPPALAGKPEIRVAIQTSRTVTPPADGRELGLAFGVVEIR